LEAPERAIKVIEPAWLKARRERAAARLQELDLPRFKGSIGWEFSDLGDFSLEQFSPVEAGQGDEKAEERVEQLLALPGEGSGVTQVDGACFFNGKGKTATGNTPLIVLPLETAVTNCPELVEEHLGRIVDTETGDLFVAANDAEWVGGVFVYVPRGVHVDEPIALNTILDTENGALHRRVLVVLEEGAEAEVWEQYLSTSAESEAMLNAVVEIVVGENARLTYLCGQNLNENSYIFGTQRAEVARNGNLDWVAIGTGSAKGKVRMETLLAGEGAHAKVTGAFTPHARQHLDYDTTQEHGAPNTSSDLAFRGILSDRSTAVWRGMIKVDPGAQQTDAFQECRNLLLSKRSHADAIPGLEILANDVRCTHAAAIAQIDQDQLFYLRSRGLHEEVAKRLVIEGFMAALIERFEAGPIREAVAGALDRRLEQVL
jgi:Fe-S cluster assembly protein SufD